MIKNWQLKIKENPTWTFNRQLSTGEAFSGVVTWTLQSKGVYQYIELGIFKEKEFERKYLYNFNDEKVFFDDGRLFFEFPKASGEATLHKCKDDMYRIVAGDDFIQYEVSGPNKGYVSRTTFEFN
jgi:hypothetical protein